jgi:hypothetical protein
MLRLSLDLTAATIFRALPPFDVAWTVKFLPRAFILKKYALLARNRLQDKFFFFSLLSDRRGPMHSTWARSFQRYFVMIRIKMFLLRLIIILSSSAWMEMSSTQGWFSHTDLSVRNARPERFAMASIASNEHLTSYDK